MNRRTTLIAFHWLTAVLIAASFSVAWLRDWMDDYDRRLFWLDVHRSIGFAVLAITLLRLPQRAMLGPVSQRGEFARVLWIASRVTHGVLYAGLIVMPLLGWAQSSARSRHVALFGLGLPSLVKHDRDLADTLGWWHEQVGWVLLGFIGLHVAAALVHHFVFRDETLQSMFLVSRHRAGGIAVAKNDDS